LEERVEMIFRRMARQDKLASGVLWVRIKVVTAGEDSLGKPMRHPYKRF
jgi:hypothetical protein